jgi:hypothetical protein
LKRPDEPPPKQTTVPATQRNPDQLDLGKFLALALQLVGLALITYYFQLETQAFFQLSVLAYVGFGIHYFLPFRYRLPFFALLSLVGIVWVLGTSGALPIIGIGLGLIVICHLPVPMAWRVALLLLAGCALALLRVGWNSSLASAAWWPILGSMFMFRLIQYVYDRQFDDAPPTWSSTLSYFFLLPNVCFPLFPVVDYRAFRRTYYDEERHAIYQVGAQWIARGLVQLILYRLVYYYLSIGPSEVGDAGDLARYVVSGFLLYLRISGHFHIIIGMLRLFGFNLPETHHWYFLASSFTDFWRRINIYWKDFMMKIFYYPVFLRLRAFGMTSALVISTLFVFFVTWALHAVQWFWLRGSYLFTWNDVLFWTILGLLVVVNALYEAKFGRRRSLGRRERTIKEQVVLVLKTMATFSIICVLWSLWTSESLSAWWAVWRAAGRLSITDSRLVIAGLIGLVGFAAAVIICARLDELRASGWRPSFSRLAAMNVSSLVAVAAIGTPQLYARWLPQSVSGTVVEIVTSLREIRLSGHDADMVERGYYEQLLNVQNFNSRLWEVYASWPLNWSRLEDTGALRLTGDFLKQELVPNKQIHFRNATLTTNQWGMRDRDYVKSPPPGVRRIALVGSSHVMGYGVDDDATFDSVLEGLLNSRGLNQFKGRFEVLNFAVDGYCPLQELLATERRVLDFNPDVVAYFAHSAAAHRAGLHLAEAAREGVPIPYPALAEIVVKAGIEQGDTKIDVERRIKPYSNDILSWTYRRFVEQCRNRGATPVWFYLPQAGDTLAPEKLDDLVRLATTAGFVTLDLSDCYGRHDPETIWFGAWDHHPNAHGHRLVGEKLWRLFSDNERSLFDRPSP